MVEKVAPQGDGVVRNFIYGHFRTDIPAQEGYSHEIVNTSLDKKYYDDIESLPLLTKTGCTLLEQFSHKVKTQGDSTFLGTRETTGKDDKDKPIFGEY